MRALGMLLVAAALVLGAYGAPQAAVEPPEAGMLCASPETVAAALAVLGETETGRGITFGGMLFQIYAGPSGGWTVIVTRPGGPACMLAQGQFWTATPASREEPSL